MDKVSAIASSALNHVEKESGSLFRWDTLYDLPKNVRAEKLVQTMKATLNGMALKS